MEASNPPNNSNNPTSLEATSASPLLVDIDGKAIAITDPDLIQQIETSPHSVKSISKRMAARTQTERDETRTRRAGMTPVQRRRDVVREEITKNPLDREDIHHVHSVLGLCALPYRRPPEDQREYDAKYGLMSLSVEAGRLLDPATGEWVRQGLPYGTKARLMQLHICTRALRNKSPEVELEQSMSAFMRSLGFDVTGGAKGTISLFKEQMNRLAACRMKIGLWNGKDRAKTINLDPIKSFEVWFPGNPDQQMLWPSKVVLHDDFYKSLTEHALPVDIRALSAVSQSARQMDFLLWLSYRVRSLGNKDYFLTWDLVKQQFCQSEQHRMIHFQRELKQDIAKIEAVFDKTLPLKLTDKGITLKPCDPAALFVPPKKLLKPR
jgi:hypothetical protein